MEILELKEKGICWLLVLHSSLGHLVKPKANQIIHPTFVSPPLEEPSIQLLESQDLHFPKPVRVSYELMMHSYLYL